MTDDDPYHRAVQRLSAMMAAATNRVLALMTDAGLDMRGVRIRDVQPAAPHSGIPRMPPESFDRRDILDSDREIAASLHWSTEADGVTWVLRTELRADLQAAARERKEN
jgi:hypothetical protein